MKDGNEIYRVAQSYHSNGLSVIPLCTPIDSNHCIQHGLCEHPGKVPLISWVKYQNIKPTREELEGWFTKNPTANIGIITGKGSGIFILDIDGDKGRKSVEGKQLPSTVIAQTGKGLHYYFKYNGTQIKNKVAILDGVDIRGEGGLVVAPPSIHSNGKSYQWAEWATPDDCPYSDAPQWIYDLLKNDINPLNEPKKNWTKKEIPEGERNDYLFRFACSLRGKNHSEDEIENILNAINQTNCIPPLSEFEIKTIIESSRAQDSRNHPDKYTLPVSFIKPFSSLLNEKDIEIKWLSDGFLGKEVIGFIAGEPKLTKSWLALHIGLAISTGNPIIEKFPVKERAKVLYIQEEDSIALVRSRVNQLLAGHGWQQPDDDYFRYSIRSGFHIDSEENLKSLELDLENYKADLIIFDVLNKLHDLDENKQDECTKIMKKFEAIRRKFNCSILIVHHFRKSSLGGSKRGNQRMRGSSVLAGWSENSFYVTAAPNKLYEVEFESKAAQLEPFLYGLESIKDPNGKDMEIKIVFKGEATLSKTLENTMKINQSLEQGYAKEGKAGCTIKAIIEATGLSDRTVRDHLKTLQSEGVVILEPVDQKGNAPKAYIPANLHSKEDELNLEGGSLCK